MSSPDLFDHDAGWPYDFPVMDYLPVLNVQQPYATAIASWGKNVENRSKPLRENIIGQWVLILASKSSKVTAWDIQYISERLGKKPPLTEDKQFVKGSIVAAVKFIGSTQKPSEKYQQWHNDNDFAWEIGDSIDFESSSNDDISGYLTLFWNAKEGRTPEEVQKIFRSVYTKLKHRPDVLSEMEKQSQPPVTKKRPPPKDLHAGAITNVWGIYDGEESEDEELEAEKRRRLLTWTKSIDLPRAYEGAAAEGKKPRQYVSSDDDYEYVPSSSSDDDRSSDEDLHEASQEDVVPAIAMPGAAAGPAGPAADVLCTRVDKITKYDRLDTLFKSVAAKDGPVIAYTQVAAASSVSCKRIDEEHRNAIRHLLSDGSDECAIVTVDGKVTENFIYLPADNGNPAKTDKTPGIGQVFRNCTLLTLKQSFPLYEELRKAGVKIEPHTERAWRTRTRRCFQGVLTRHSVPKETKFRQLDEATVATLNPALYVLPLVNEGDKSILVCYGCDPANGMCLQHGIADGEKLKAIGWHSEPGGNTLVYITRNTCISEKGKKPKYESAGFYLKITRKDAEASYLKRLEKFKNGKYTNCHDHRVLKWAEENRTKVTLAMTNYVCVSCNALPLCWAGSNISDIQGINGNGAMNNPKKFMTQNCTLKNYHDKKAKKYKTKITPYFHLKQGVIAFNDIPIGGPEGWPKGIRPPLALQEWAANIGTPFHPERDPTDAPFKPVDSLVDLARQYPEVFLAYFPEFDENVVYDEVAQKYTCLESNQEERPQEKGLRTGTRKSARQQNKDPEQLALNWKTLSSLLTKVHRHAVECGGSGNCFFNSVVYSMAPLVYADKKAKTIAIRAASSNLRDRVSEWMADPGNLPFLKEYGDVAVYSNKQEPWPEYAKYIGKDKAWVQGSVEIIVTSIILQRNIDVYYYRNGPDKEPILGHTRHGKESGPPIEIAIIDESHYRAVVKDASV